MSWWKILILGSVAGVLGYAAGANLFAQFVLWRNWRNLDEDSKEAISTLEALLKDSAP